MNQMKFRIFTAICFIICLWAALAAGQPVRVACVGDSITFGMGSKVPYPTHLQTLLGPEWEVGNFGVSGRTLLKKGDKPWWNEPAFQQAQDFRPDVVIIMLGTNDTKPENWKYKDEFYPDYSDLVDVFDNLPGEQKIYICRPCPVPEPGHWGINEANVKLEIGLIDQLAAEKGLGVIDMHAALEDHPEMLPDRVHPNSDGALLMAKAAFAALTAVPPRVNSLFADHMVLQRDCKIIVWGPTDDDEIITVEFAGQKVNAKNRKGKWTARLKPMKACSEPQTMTISSKDGGVHIIRDILIGDVWVASGQSNMERQLGPRSGQKDIVGWTAAAASANYPLIRQFYVPRHTSMAPLEDGNGSWTVCSPETVTNFCGVGYFFIRDVYESQKIPMAMIHTTWGGTPAEAWTSLPKLKEVSSYADFARIVEHLAENPAELNDMRSNWLNEHDTGTQNGWWKEKTVNASGVTSSNHWKTVDAPSDFETMGIHDFDGIVWLRKEFELPADAAGKSATLELGQIDDRDSTWVNGTLIGETDGWTQQRSYTIPADLLKTGRNVIAIRIIDTKGQGGWAPATSELKLTVQNNVIPLSGTWQEQIGKQFSASDMFFIRGQLDHCSPAMLFNAMINPLLPQPIKGVIWYQGESNNDRANDYEDLFAAMIQDWRARWNCGDFPFLYVQIAPHNEMSPELRESQRKVLEREPNTAMVVTTDVGDAGDIHPTRKEPVGQRLALAARALAYGEEIEYSGPLYESMTIEDGQAIIYFTHTGSGLTARDGELRGFEVAGADENFVPAQAVIDGDTVVVSSAEVSEPAEVRYGWANVPDVNLFNKEGLPASPFSTTMK